MIINLPGTFRKAQRSDIFPANVIDENQQSIGGWTTGAVLIDSVDLPSSSPTTPLRVLSVSITADIILFMQSLVPIYGKLGIIRAGMAAVTGGAQQTGTAIVPYDTQPLQIPPDESLIAPLWDPAVDALPPSSSGLTGGLLTPPALMPVTVEITPPIPQEIAGGAGGLLVGIWMSPSLVTPQPGIPQSAAALAVINGTYSLDYEKDY